MQKYGTGALNIDASRIGFTSEADRKSAAVHDAGSSGNTALNWNAGDKKASGNEYRLSEGRWPANVLFDEEAVTGQEWSRFFYVAKASKRERNAGLEGMPEALGGSLSGGNDKRKGDKPQLSMRANHHPTVKPIALMEYLIRLVTPPGGNVLDPFMGSGTTGVAAIKNGVNFIGIEREAEYYKIAEARINKAKGAA